MSRDWNIVDDEVPDEHHKVDDARLSANRIRLITLERSSNDRTRQWTLGVSTLAMLAALSLAGRGVTWLTHDANRSWAWAALVGACFLCAISLRLLIRVRHHRL